MKLIDIFEAKNWVMDDLAKYIGQTDLYLHFTNVAKVGVNPKTMHKDTPIGIFAYPFDYAFDEMKTKTLPYAADTKFIYVLKNRGRILDLSNISKKEYVDAVLSMKKYFPDKPHHQKLLDNFAKKQPSGWGLWRMSRTVANQVGDSTIAAWNGVLRNMGYDAVEDWGSGIIHPVEHTQICFLSTKAYTVVDMMQNNHLNDVTAADRLDGI